MEPDQFTQINSRLRMLEQHIINLIIPIQNISNILTDKNERTEILALLNHFKTTDININDAPFKKVAYSMTCLMQQLKEVGKRTDEIDIGQTYSEIKYIGKRLCEIEKLLEKLDKEGIPKKVSVSLNLENYELVKNCERLKEDFSLNDALNSIDSREAQAIIHRLGLFGNEACTFAKLAPLLNLKNAETASKCFRKAIRKLRNPSCIEKVKNCNCLALKNEVLGIYHVEDI